MTYNHQIHNFSHVFKAIVGTLVSIDMFNPKNQLIVLNYHGTQHKNIHNFIKQINYLKKKYTILSPSEFEDIVYSNKNISGKNIVLTFDDGIKNNLYAIEELNKLGISAYFFVVPQFIETKIDAQKTFFIKNIRPIINNEIDIFPEDFSALSWNDLKEISKKHTIGCHSYSHTMVKDIFDNKRLEKEIIESKLLIEREIGIKVNAFCSINNTLHTIGIAEIKLLKEHYQLHFSTFGGNNLNIDPFLIKRINVESYWLFGAFKFALSFLEFYRWHKKISLFKNSLK